MNAGDAEADLLIGIQVVHVHDIGLRAAARQLAAGAIQPETRQPLGDLKVGQPPQPDRRKADKDRRMIALQDVPGVEILFLAVIVSPTCLDISTYVTSLPFSIKRSRPTSFFVRSDELKSIFHFSRFLKGVALRSAAQAERCDEGRRAAGRSGAGAKRWVAKR